MPPFLFQSVNVMTATDDTRLFSVSLNDDIYLIEIK